VRRTVPGQADLRHPGRARLHRPGTDRQPAQADRAVRADLPPGPGSDHRAAPRRRPLQRRNHAGTRFITKTIFIAAGVGSFQARTIKVDGIDKFEGSQLHYRVKDPSLFEGKNLVICGGGDSALDWALNFVGKAESVVLLHRREDFRAAPASVAKMKQLCDDYEMQLIIGQVTGFDEKTASCPK
jgi:thioredoxin reductase